jgi:hypothetical protein
VKVVLGILSSCIVHQHFYFTWTILPSSSFLYLLANFGKFWQENYANMWGHYGFRIMRIFLRPLNEVSGSTIDILWWYKVFYNGRLCPICCLRELSSVTHSQLLNRLKCESKVSRMEEWGVGVRSLTCSTSRVEGRVGAPR